jgi:hypothetical protein
MRRSLTKFSLTCRWRIILFLCLIGPLYGGYAQPQTSFQSDVIKYDEPGKIARFQVCRLLGMGGIDQSTNDIELRIYRWQAFSNPKIFVLKKTKKGFSAQLYSFFPHYKSIKSIPYLAYVSSLDEVKQEDLKSTQPLAQLWDTLVNMDICTLQTFGMKEAMRLHLGTGDDGTLYTVEVKVNNQYRQYAFDHPDIYEKITPYLSSVSQFNGIIDFIERQFNISLQEFDYLYEQRKENK